MGTIGDKLNYLAETKNQMKTALKSKGQDIKDNDSFRSYVGKINNLSPTPTGTINISQNGTVNVANYANANVNVSSYPPNWEEIGLYQTPTQVLNGFDVAQRILTDWDPHNIYLHEKYADNMELIYLPTLELINDTSIRADLTDFCRDCSNLVAIGNISILNLGDIAGDVISDRAFAGCERLIDIGWLDIHNIVSANDMFAQCGSLSDDSLNIIMAMLENVSEFYEGQKTLSEIGFNEDQAMRCKGLGSFQTLVELGWSTGYRI